MRKQGAQRQRDVLDDLKRQGHPVTACEILDEFKGGKAGLAPSAVHLILSMLNGRGGAHPFEPTSTLLSCQRVHGGHIAARQTG